jgi:hypothetical protein
MLMAHQRGFKNPVTSGVVQPSPALPTHMVGEAHVYVQAARLKTCATFLVTGFLNSPITNGEHCDAWIFVD